MEHDGNDVGVFCLGRRHFYLLSLDLPGEVASHLFEGVHSAEPAHVRAADRGEHVTHLRGRIASSVTLPSVMGQS